MAKTDAVNTSIPADLNAPSLGAGQIRTLARAVIELLQKDHYTGSSSPYSEDAAGEHAKVTLRAASKPSSAASKGFLYTKDVGSGVIEVFYEDAAGNEKQLTTAGKLNIAATEAVLLTGDQTVAGVKTLSSSPIVPAPTTDLQASTKKYVDDKVAAIGGQFGSWATKAVTTIYQAATDGFVLAMIHENFNSGDYIQILTDSSATPSTVRQKLFNHYQEDTASLMCPVKKNDYYQVTIDGLEAGNVTVYWLPSGA